MADDFKDWVSDYSRKGDGAKRAEDRRTQRHVLVLIWLILIVASIGFPPLFVISLPFTIFLFFYACREWMG